MSTLNQTKKVIWAIDPFEMETRPNPGIIQEFLAWSKAAGYAIQPIHILPVSTIDPAEIDDGTWLQRSVPSAEKTAAQYLTDLGAKDTLPPRVPLCPVQSRSKAVRRLLDLAESEGSPMIALSSHGRTGLGRLALGSFAENLLLQSRIPVLFLSHSDRKPESKIQRILFPTDLSKNSRTAFRLLLPQAKALDAEVVLLYAVAVAPYAVAGPAALGSVDPGIPEDYFEVQAAWGVEELKLWVAEANGQGVKARSIVKEEGVTSQIARAVLATADHEKVQLIAMASLSGAFTSFALGSVARDVFRSQRYPVWVCGPKVFGVDAIRDHHASTASP